MGALSSSSSSRRQAAGRPSLPVASLTLSSSSSSSNRTSSSRSAGCSWQDDDSAWADGSNSKGGLPGAQALSNLLAAAVPLDITIKL
jgi:hypothetical protein